MKSDVRSMVWYVLMLVVAFFVSLYNYISFMSEDNIQKIFFS